MKYVKKEFLNLDDHHSDATICTTFNFYSEEIYTNHDGSIMIRDCNHKVTLSVGVEDEGDDSFENSMHKIDVIVNTLLAFKNDLKDARKEYLRRKQKIDEKEKEKEAKCAQ